ncbi:hypothetical protein DdX_20330 [Ditylenchus destructor]|uniref:Uncharacterized protein n=1 Tax=Ditylenchus destructor TaxID=166010 RepID=A0AAD4MLK2_9BILA|nr:hypothetical protein DdX_20330 [Ditylenchus destructor]
MHCPASVHPNGMPLWTHVWNQARRVWRLLHRRNFHQRRNQRTQRRRERRQRERRRGTRMFGFPRADENWNTQIRQGIPPPPFPPCYDNIERERREDFITSDSEPEFTVHFTPAEVRRIAEMHRPRSSSSSSMGMSTLFALIIMASISICQGFSPMICPTSAPGALWRIKSSASKCEQLLDQGVPFPLRIYRPNTKHIAIEAHHCKSNISSPIFHRRWQPSPHRQRGNAKPVRWRRRVPPNDRKEELSVRTNEAL